MSYKKYKTFTLIEMLIVIVIIGILAAALVPRLQSVQARARDTKRKLDIKSIYNAEEIYKLDNGKYTQEVCAYNSNCYVFSDTPSTWMANLITAGIMTSIPVDPKNVSIPPRSAGGYVYGYGNIYDTPIHSYDLMAQLENPQDKDRCAVKHYISVLVGGWCGGYSPMMYVYSPYSNPDIQ